MHQDLLGFSINMMQYWW